MEQTRLKPWQGLVAFAVHIAASLTLLGYAQYKLGWSGLVITELFTAALAVAGMFIFRGAWRDLFPAARVRARHVIGSVILWFGVTILVLAILEATMLIFPQILDVNRELNDFFANESFLAAVILTPILAGVCEELFYRGLILSSLGKISSSFLKILICGVMFGIAHLSPYRFLPTAIAGVMFAFIVLRTGNIFVAMALHFWHDFVISLISYNQSGATDYAEIAEMLETQSSLLWSGVVLIALLSLIPIAIGLVLMRREKQMRTPYDDLM
ncbi:MAG: CPBP family intramembrane metalloprotease [Oscillospiraceae bacterium]|jgi:sodium transport system permease protein|nr:CPBP family intramembrane metalloprotease [Oscillospiraceae bacterium]